MVKYASLMSSISGTRSKVIKLIMYDRTSMKLAAIVMFISGRYAIIESPFMSDHRKFNEKDIK